jgi:hypothetical protein
LVTNGTFDSNIDDWGDLGNWTSGSAVWTSGAIDVTVVSYQGAAQVITTEVGTEYEVTFDVVSVSGGDTARIYVGPATNPSAAAILNKNSLSPGSYTYIIRATSASHGLGLSTTSGGNSAVWDNISVKKISSHAAIAPSDSARPTLATENSPISSREVLTTTFGWNITDGGRA